MLADEKEVSLSRSALEFVVATRTNHEISKCVNTKRGLFTPKLENVDQIFENIFVCRGSMRPLHAISGTAEKN